MSNKKIAIIQTGETIKPALRKYGDFDSWFIQGLQANPDQVSTHRVFEDAQLPEIETLSGIIITGSSAMVTDQHPWSVKTQHWLEKSLPFNIPTLAVCYGHQLMTEVLGGKVDYNPNGRQIGQTDLSLKPAASGDFLFDQFTDKKTMAVFVSHSQSVIKPPSNITLLGTSPLDHNHCYRYQSHVWCLQFHPEWNAKISACYIKHRAKELASEGLNVEQLLHQLEPNNNGSLLLKRFFQRVFFNPNPDIEKRIKV